MPVTSTTLLPGEPGVVNATTVVTQTQTTQTPLGDKYNFAIVVQLPLPFLDLNIAALAAKYVVNPVLGMLHVPKAHAYLQKNLQSLVDNVNNDVVKLVKAIPEASVSIQVRLGSASLVNVKLIAEKTYVAVPTPHFVLDLPNFAIGLGPLPVPTLPPIIIRVPIPVPVLTLPTVSITGGNVTGGVSVSPVPISDPIYLPKF